MVDCLAPPHQTDAAADEAEAALDAPLSFWDLSRLVRERGGGIVIG